MLVLVGWLAAVSMSCATSQDEAVASNGGTSGSHDAGADASQELGDAHQAPDGTWPEGQAPPDSSTRGTGGSGGSGTGGAGTGGTGGCTPQCAGRECGPDQCGGSCAPGCAANQQCNPQGLCLDACTETWLSPVAHDVYGIALQPAGDVYAVGSQGSDAWVGTLSTCNGSVKATSAVAVPGASSTTGSAVAVVGSDVYIVGNTVTPTDPQNGMWARLSTGSLSLLWAQPLYGSSGVDELWGIAAPPNGSLWMAGASSTDTTSTFWGVKGEPSGAACGFFALPGQGAGRNVIASGADVYMVGALGTAAVVARFDASSCSTSGPCPCNPVWQSQPLQVGASMSEARGIAIAGSSLYVSGFAQETAGSTDYEAFVARVDINSGAIIGTWVSNPTAQIDALTDIATDGQRLYASGLMGWDGSASFASGTAVVVALPFDISSATTMQWYTQIPSLDLAYRIALDTAAGGGVYLGGLGGSSGYVVRCTKAGVCP